MRTTVGYDYLLLDFVHRIKHILIWLAAGMGTEVQFKMFFPGYCFTEDINDKAGNRSLQLSCDNSTLKNGNQLNGFSRWPTSYIHFKCEKEELRKMILKQESIFRHQVQRLACFILLPEPISLSQAPGIKF